MPQHGAYAPLKPVDHPIGIAAFKLYNNLSEEERTDFLIRESYKLTEEESKTWDPFAQPFLDPANYPDCESTAWRLRFPPGQRGPRINRASRFLPAQPTKQHRQPITQAQQPNQEALQQLVNQAPQPTILHHQPTYQDQQRLQPQLGYQASTASASATSAPHLVQPRYTNSHIPQPAEKISYIGMRYMCMQDYHSQDLRVFTMEVGDIFTRVSEGHSSQGGSEPEWWRGKNHLGQEKWVNPYKMQPILSHTSIPTFPVLQPSFAYFARETVTSNLENRLRHLTFQRDEHIRIQRSGGTVRQGVTGPPGWFYGWNTATEAGWVDPSKLVWEEYKTFYVSPGFKQIVPLRGTNGPPGAASGPMNPYLDLF